MALRLEDLLRIARGRFAGQIPAHHVVIVKNLLNRHMVEQVIRRGPRVMMAELGEEAAQEDRTYRAAVFFPKAAISPAFFAARSMMGSKMNSKIFMI
jgi:hypothetical protein